MWYMSLLILILPFERCNYWIELWVVAESTLLQWLAPQAITTEIKVKNPDLGTFVIDKDKQVPTKGIFLSFFSLQ